MTNRLWGPDSLITENTLLPLSGSNHQHLFFGIPRMPGATSRSVIVILRRRLWHTSCIVHDFDILWCDAKPAPKSLLPPFHCCVFFFLFGALGAMRRMFVSGSHLALTHAGVVLGTEKAQLQKSLERAKRPWFRSEKPVLAWY